MPIKFFVHRGDDGQEMPPDTSHETDALRDIACKLHEKFHQQTNPYFAVANVKRPSADLVIISCHGMGIVELKHHEGPITASVDGTWRDRHGDIIHAGSAMKHRLNPHQQIQEYTENLRARLVSYLSKFWKLNPSVLRDVRVHTGVCFTNPAANMDEARCRMLTSTTQYKAQEPFEVMTSDSIANWALKLRFGLKNPASHEVYELKASQIQQLVDGLLAATQWSEIEAFLPKAGQVLASLVLVENGQRNATAYAIKQEVIRIGRSQDCDVVIPAEYVRVGNQHAEIRLGMDGRFYLKNLHSNGTFVVGETKEVGKSHPLVHNQRILLGGNIDQLGICKLDFLRDPSEVKRVTTVR